MRALPVQGPGLAAAITAYAEAFARPPYHDTDRGRDVSQRLRQSHVKFPGFAGLVAVDDGGDTLGMIYGYTSLRGQWWHDVVRAVGGRAYDGWLRDSVELSEVAVRPRAQGLGIGTALVETFLAGRTEAACLLSTRTDSRAHELYARLGFETLLTMPFLTGGHDFFIMGRRLR